MLRLNGGLVLPRHLGDGRPVFARQCFEQAASTLASEANCAPGRFEPQAGIVPNGPRPWSASVREDSNSYLYLMVSRKNPG
jgi:hypothetical protein